MLNQKHESRICPHCGKEFICKANRIQQCECVGVRLSPETMEYIKNLYNECLCITCLKTLEISGRDQ